MDLARLMRILTVNAGSSTLKLRLVAPDDQIEASLDLDPWDGSVDAAVLGEWLHGLDSVDATGHRVVHGGVRFTTAVPIDDETSPRRLRPATRPRPSRRTWTRSTVSGRRCSRVRRFVACC